MGHDLHFIERLERLDADEVSFAFSLYRNTPLVQQLLARVPVAGIDRVAIAVTHEPEPPYVLVTRDGHFVTCLAAGMRHDLPVISRAAVDRARRDDEALRLMFEAAENLRDDLNYGEIVRRFHTGPRISREEMREVMTWAPALSSTMSTSLLESSRRYVVAWTHVRTPEVLKEKHAAHVKEVWIQSWFLGHLLGPIASGMRHEFSGPKHVGNRGLFACLGLQTHLPGVVLRGVWATASLGDLVIDDLEENFRHSLDPSLVWSGGLALLATGLRWPSLRARVAATLEQQPARLERVPPSEEDLGFFVRLREVLANPKRALGRHIDLATAMLRHRVGDVSDLDATTLLAYSAFESPAVGRFADFARLVEAMPFVAASEFADLYLPKALLDRLPPEDSDASARTYVEERRAHRRRLVATTPPASPPPTAGRNDPCPCGSGKKFKKCCGA